MLTIAGKIAHPSSGEKKQWLSPPQLRFAYCYGAAEEIRMYLTNHRGSHIEAAEDYVEKVGTALTRASTLDLDLVEGIYPYHYWQPERRLAKSHTESLNSMGLLADRPKWYKLQPDTEAIIQAFRHFLPKFADRLKDRKDLPAIGSAITELSRFLYTEIPELSESKSQSEFEQAGMHALLNFAHQINDLPSYRSEPANQTQSEKASQKLLSLARCLSWPFIQSNLLVSFFAWYVLFLVLFGGGFFFAFTFIGTLRMDSTVVTTLIGGPIATGITAATLPRVTKSK